MAKVILVCGKIASGKSWYCRKLLNQSPALLLSVDEVTYRLFDKELGDRHDEVSAKVQAYLFDKALEAVRAGADVLLDWGFWTRADRQKASRFFAQSSIQTEWHYIDVPEDMWRENIARRNAAVLAGEDSSYYVDEGLLRKLESRFQVPEPSEVDVWFQLNYNKKAPPKLGPVEN